MIESEFAVGILKAQFIAHFFKKLRRYCIVRLTNSFLYVYIRIGRTGVITVVDGTHSAVAVIVRNTIVLNSCAPISIFFLYCRCVNREGLY